MWVSSHDDVGLFLLRARILLVPTDGLFEVYLPNIQPDPLCITLIVAPAWWRQLDVHALLVAVQDQDRDPFVVVVWPDDDLVDLLPLTLQPRNEDVGVFADFPTDGPDPSTWPHPPNGGVVVMHATEGVFAPLPTAQSILANDAIAVGAATITQPAHRPGNTIGLLGAGFEQGTLQLNSGSVNSQIGDAIGEPSTEFSVWVQMAMFHELVIHGQHVGRCIAYKMKRCLSPLAATAIFVDSRKVGRPVCCRCLQHTFLEPAEVLQLISVQLPEGYRAMQVRVASDVATQRALLFMNCQSVVVWAESMTPHALLAGPDPASAGEPDTDSSDGPSDVSESPRDHQPGLRDSQDSGSRGHCGRRLDRSRSPTPAASGPTEVHLAAGRPAMDKSLPGGRVCVGRGVPTPCRGRERLQTPAGPHGEQFVWKRVHPEHRRLSAYGAAIMLATVGAASAECSAVEDSSDVGEFFVGDCSVMWMPGFSEHVRAPYRLADTPDNDSILGFPRAVMGTVIDDVCAPMRRCALDGLARKFLTVYDGDAAVAAADAPRAALHIDRKTLRLGEYLPLCDTRVHCCPFLPVAMPAVEWFALDAGQCCTPWTQDVARELHVFVPFGQLQRPPAGLRKPERIWDWISHGVTRSLVPGEVLQVISDGSYKHNDGTMGWGLAFAAIDPECRSTPTFLGCCWGSLDCFRQCSADIVGEANAFKAEVAGLFFAALGVIQLHVASPVQFLCDNISALRIAEGTNHAGPSLLVRAMRSLHSCVQMQVVSTPCYAHVRGHSGHAANELTDALAEYAIESGKACCPFALTMQRLFEHDGCQFDWAVHAAWDDRHKGQGPSFCNGVLAWNRVLPPLTCEPMDVLKPFCGSRSG